MITENREIRVQVRDLKRGDVLVPTQRTVLQVWVSRAAGKRNVDLMERGGRRYTATFGAYTRVTVEREEMASEIPPDRKCLDCGRRWDGHDWQGGCPDAD
jgi:hypothetical protein